jgi:signal transduction histidine kinase
LLCGLSTFAQAGVVDSLWQVLERTQAPGDRFDLYCELSLEYAYNQPDSALLMLERAEALRSPAIAPRQLAIYHRRRALAYKLQSQYDEALLSMDSSLLLFRTLGDSTEVAKALVNKGTYYQQLDQLDLAFDFFQKGRRLLEETEGEELAQAKVINNLSVIYISWGMHAEAIALLFEAIDIKEQLQDYGSLANSYGTLASLYMARDELEQALSYHERALEAAEKSGNRYLEAVFLFNLGENYKDLAAYERAETYMREARSIALDINNSYLLGYCVVGLAEVAKERGQLQTARRQLENSLELDALANSAYMRSNAYLQLAEIALEQGRLSDAQNLGKEGLALAKRIQELLFVSQGEQLLAKIYERQGDAASALKHYKAYKAVQDSILSQRNSERINKLEAQYDHQLEQKDYELQLAATEKQLDRAANQAQRWYMLFVTLGLLVLAGVVGILLYLNRRHRHSQVALNAMNEELYQSNEQLEIAYLDTVSTKQQLESANHKLQQFVYAASHDFQQQLDGINTASRQLEEQLKASPQSLRAQRLLHQISHNSQQMEQLISDLLCYYQLAEEAPETAASTSLSAIAKQAESECCAAEIEPSKAVVEIAPDLPEVHVDPKHAQSLLASLMRYAIRHSSDQQPLHLRIGSQAQKGDTVVFVEDDGLSVPAEHRQAIFQPFFRLPDDNHRHSSGMELAISTRVVSMYGGKIWWEQTQHGHGNRFCFTLPIAGTSASKAPFMATSTKKENP